MLTICTTGFKVKKFYVLLTQYIYLFCTDLGTLIISPHSINRQYLAQNEQRFVSQLKLRWKAGAHKFHKTLAATSKF